MISPEKKQFHDFLDELTTRNPNTSPLPASPARDDNERLKLILDTSAYMAQLVENIKPRFGRNLSRTCPS